MHQTDQFQRVIDYIRIGVTDRCNLRCFYCMPEQGIQYEKRSQILSYEEIIRLLKQLGALGFKKVRFTGGEPFLRKDFPDLLIKTAELSMFDQIRITTNGTLIQKHIPLLQSLGINTINLSLDSLDEKRFFQITRRNDFEIVYDTFKQLIDQDFTVKVNAVIMNGINNDDILPLVELAHHKNVSVRFIEEMPFNGGYRGNDTLFSAHDIKQTILKKHPSLTAQASKHGDTATNYTIDGLKGTIGIIPAFSRSFCNTCNRLRITPKGDIKTCLYDGGVFNIKEFMRNGVTDQELKNQLIHLIKMKPENGFVAEKNKKEGTHAKESMSTIGG